MFIRFKACVVCGCQFRLGELQNATTRRCPTCTRPVKTCPTCGKEFTCHKERPEQVCCSVGCSARSPKARARAAATRKALAAPRPQCLMCGKVIKDTRKGTRRKYCSTRCYHLSPAGSRAGNLSIGRNRDGPRVIEADDPPPPSRKEIAAMCAEIRAGWSEEERLQRLRVDWRPQAWEVPLSTVHDD